MPQAFNIRPIQINDNHIVSHIITHVLEEHGCIGSGWASSDSEMNDIFSAYQGEGQAYFVLENSSSSEIFGCGGFAPLKGTHPEEKVCELRKLYLISQSRGQGLGKTLLSHVLDQARQAGYKKIYLETSPALSAAVGLYEHLGFQKLSKNLGNTGHQEKCNIYMVKQLG
jgi:putative acetyltransferase